MSQVKLTLQPPPNVDFVSGYPGIPPSQDRPQASVKGAIEVRLPPAGVKAKWVRIELRKVETLPGGGAGNTFYDFVGPSPINLWSTPDEYGLLRSQDFPFSIRIPESIPPTLSLDNRAGIGYELVATVCTKGKRGFLRKAKSVVSTAATPIIIDKHELHSTWPVYCQPESRQLGQDGVNLIVERSGNCYGPGDRISVIATVRSDSVHTVILRGFEFFLKETTIYRSGAHTVGKKNSPQVKMMNITESKVAVNTTLYGGSTHTSELSCMLPPNHTTTTLTSARHIDINYLLCIKALMGTGTHILMELPVMISNWQRAVSFEAISRIGPTPNLSLLPPAGASAINRVDPIRMQGTGASATLPINRPIIDNYGRTNASGAYNTLPAGGAAHSQQVDEFGAASRPTTANTAPTGSSTIPATAPANRPHVKGAPSQDMPQGQRNVQPTGSGSASVSGSSAALPSQQQWLTAEEEKLRLFEQARMKVLQTQGPAAAPPSAARSSPPPQATGSASGSSSKPVVANPATSSPAKGEWPSAEEEKWRYQQAAAAVAKTQGVAPPSVTTGPTHTRDTSDPKPSGSGSKPSAAAQLYAEAIKARTAAASGGASTTSTLPKATPSGAYPTAEQEKAAYKRYHEARQAADAIQHHTSGAGGSGSAPIAYESLFPASSSPAPPPPADAPPPFNTAAGPDNIMAHLSEKERLRRKYEEQDALAAARVPASPPPPAVYTSSPPPAEPVAPAGPGPLPNQYANALEEKEALRRRFEARDAQRAASATARPSQSQPQPPIRSNTNTPPRSSSPVRSPGPNQQGFRPTPTPPANQRVLSAAEEKALLKAKLEARDNARSKPTNNGNPPNGFAPPLAPRPPADYIKATQEEDARFSRMAGDLNGVGSSSSSSKPSSGSALDIKPFTPFQAEFDNASGSSYGQPPLPLSRPSGD